MAAGVFQPVFTTSSSPTAARPSPVLDAAIKDSLKLPTLLAIGALAQTVVVLLLPAPLALIPLILVLARSVITTVLQSTSPRRNAFASGVVPGRVTAQLPPGKSGARPLVVFHLGVRFNHPLGVLSPGARDISGYFTDMTSALTTRRHDLGMLHFDMWRATERETNNTLMMIAYFRDVDGLNRFAHGTEHRAGWDWYRRFAREAGNSHISIFHETFVARPGDYETIYIDCPPLLLGAADIKVDPGGENLASEGAAETWVRPLVSADHPALRSQSKRMGRTLAFEGGDEMY